MAQTIDLYMDQGSDFTAVLPSITNPDGSILNISLYSGSLPLGQPYAIHSYIRRSYASNVAVALTVTITDATNGVITLSLNNEETAGLYPTRYVYDVVIADVDGIVTTVFEGLVSVNPGVTSRPRTTLITPYMPEDYGGLPEV